VKNLILIAGLTTMSVFVVAAADREHSGSSAKSAGTAHSHTAATTPAHSTSSTHAQHAGQGKKKGLTKQHARAANSKNHKGHKKFLLFGKRSG